MPVMTLRPKNQVTVPQSLVDGLGLRVGDPIEFEPLANGGIGLYRYGHDSRRSLWATAHALAETIPGLDHVEFDLPERDLDGREVEW